MQANRHTIILMQTSQHRATRTFMDYDSISQAMDGLYELFVFLLFVINARFAAVIRRLLLALILCTFLHSFSFGQCFGP